MSRIQINSAVTIDHSDNGWTEFKKLIDGTIEDFAYTWADEGSAYVVVAIDGSVAHVCSFNKGDDAADFEANFKKVRSIEPRAADGKLYVLPNIFPGEVILNFTGASDANNPVERLGGELFKLEQSSQGMSDPFVVNFVDPVFLAGGHLEWNGGSFGSFVYMELVAPASTVKAPAVANEGNINLVPTGLGFNILVPAPGNGTHDLDVPVPVPALDDETNLPNGLWSYSDPWLGLGEVSPGPIGSAKFNLFDAEIELAHFAKVSTARDDGTRDMMAQSIKPKWILPQWKIEVMVYNADAQKTLRATWDLLVARRKSA